MFQKHFLGSFYGSLELTYCVCLRPGLYKPKRSVWSKKALLVLLTLHNECSFCQTSDREKSYFSITLLCRRLMPPSTGTKNEIHVGWHANNIFAPIWLLPISQFPHACLLDSCLFVNTNQFDSIGLRLSGRGASWYSNVLNTSYALNKSYAGPKT